MTKKRFIAGAVCPRCGAMDKIVAYTLEDQQIRECVKCDFSDRLDNGAPVAELQTRVTARPKAQDPDVQPLKFYKRPVNDK